jgi:hypothetical protein
MNDIVEPTATKDALLLLAGVGFVSKSLQHNLLLTIIIPLRLLI